MFELFKRKKAITTKTTVSPNLPLLEKIGRGSASWLSIVDRQELARTFNTVSEVYSPIVYSGAAFSNMKMKLFSTDKDGQEIKQIHSHDILTRLAAPNPLNNWKDFLLNYYVNKKVFGNGYIFKYTPTGFNRALTDSVLWVLPSQYVYPVPVSRTINNYYREDMRKKFVAGYNFFTREAINNATTWGADEILHQKEPNLILNDTFTDVLVQLLEGRSPLSTLVEPISNIKKAYEAQNVILSKRGALGVLSPKNAKDAIGPVTLTDTQKEILQKQFAQYGLSREDWQYIITNVEMTWTPMSLPIAELQLFEGIENSMIAICNTLNFPIVLLNYLKGSTFNNVNELKKSLYQDNIIPEANSFASELSTFLKLPEQNLVLKADFSHIPILQEDALAEAEKDQVIVETVLKLQESIRTNITTFEAAKAILLNTTRLTEEQVNKMLVNNSLKEEQNGNTEV